MITNQLCVRCTVKNPPPKCTHMHTYVVLDLHVSRSTLRMQSSFIFYACMQYGTHPACIPTGCAQIKACQNFHNCLVTVIMARPRYGPVESTPLLRASLRSMHYGSTVRGVCTDFHVMYIHEIGVEKNIDTMHHWYVLVSQRGEGLERND